MNIAHVRERQLEDNTDPRGALLARLGWAAAPGSSFDEALRHRSWCAEHPGNESNERLEFLGDSVLGLVVTAHLFRTYAGIPEGELTKARAAVVSSASLCEVAVEVGVGPALMLGKGEELTGGRLKPSILADTAEALIGAAYVEQGWVGAETLVMGLFGERIEAAVEGPGGGDFKTRLQELCARKFDSLPRYLLSEQGPDHAKEFDATVYIQGQPYGSGRGRSKKHAEQEAARQAWQALLDAGDGT